MKERPENFNSASGDEAEATLVTPRFDADEARRAHPVVPLAEAHTLAPVVDSRTGRGLPRSWPPALLAVVLLAVFAAGGVFASKVLRREQPSPAAAVQPPAAVAPAQAAPAQAAEVPAQPETSPAVEPPREVARTKPATRTRRAEDSRGAAQVEAARDDGEDLEGEDEGRRDKRRGKRRARAEDDGDKELRQALKDAAKKKAPRLIDVLVKP